MLCVQGVQIGSERARSTSLGIPSGHLWNIHLCPFLVPLETHTRPKTTPNVAKHHPMDKKCPAVLLGILWDGNTTNRVWHGDELPLEAHDVGPFVLIPQCGTQTGLHSRANRWFSRCNQPTPTQSKSFLFK